MLENYNVQKSILSKSIRSAVGVLFLYFWENVNIFKTLFKMKS